MTLTRSRSRDNRVATSVEVVAGASCQGRSSTDATASDDGASGIVNLGS